MEKISGRFYVLTLIFSTAGNSALYAFQAQTALMSAFWTVSFLLHVACAVLIARGGVK